jgi:hypothetical protein
MPQLRGNEPILGLNNVYNSISHSDSVTMVPSFYFYVRVVGRGKDRWF